MRHRSKSILWFAAMAVLAWRASACSSDSGGPAPDFTVSVDTPTATTLGTQVVLHVHLTSIAGDTGIVTFNVTGAPSSWTVAPPVSPVTLTANGQATGNVTIDIPTNGDPAAAGQSVTVEAILGTLHHSAASRVTVANEFVIPLLRGATAGGSHWPFANGTTLHLNNGTLVTFQNGDTLAHIIHSNGGIGIAHQSTGGVGTPPGGTYGQTASGGPGSTRITCHSHLADTLVIAIP
ncbi:MAG TPA: hypothetical protein VL549_01290 [Gemmatimonadales bacterium]|nr:hypothetical protein [Gemmatimonadales bacterium]